MAVEGAMITPRILSRRDITQGEIRAICTLKNQSWPHSIESQLAWWEKNTAADDLFVTLVSDGSILAFLRLRSRMVATRGVKIGALCATEVCVHELHQKRGLGKQLMRLAKAEIIKGGSGIGYLLCRDVQEPFYLACGWHRTDASPLVESSSGNRRSLHTDERCLILDPQRRLSGPLVLFGDVF